MISHGKTNCLLISATWLCFVALIGSTEGAPQQEVGKTKTEPKGYKMEDLPHLGEEEIEANAHELKAVIKAYGPRALLVLNMPKYYKKGFEENLSECVNSEEIKAERNRRWLDLMEFFDQEGGMRFFKSFWWPKYMKMPTAATAKAFTTPEHKVLWNVAALEKWYGVKDDD